MTTDTVPLHVFEKAGLGKAPFSIVGVVRERGRSCNYCGTGIMECWIIGSSDGRTFVVGCDCVRKTGDAGLIRVVETRTRELRAARRRELKAERWRIEGERRKLAAAEKKAAQLAETPGLAEALAVDHPISRDLAEKLTRWGSLSPAQVGLALKIAREKAERAAAEATLPPEIKPAVGRQVIEGEIVSTKGVETPFGYQLKMLVSVVSPAGRFRVYGSVPASLPEELRGRRVRLTATVEPKEPGFGFFSRPAKAELLAA